MLISRVRGERAQVLDERLGAPVGPVSMAREERVGRHVAEAVVADDRDSAAGVVEDGVGGRVTGPVVNLEAPVPQLEHAAVGDGPGDLGGRFPGPERARDGLEDGGHVLVHAVLEHRRARELVVCPCLLREVANDRHATSIAATSAPERSATSETRPRWSMS